MGKTLVIGAGGVGSVAVHKMAMNKDIFTEITLASRRKFKCDDIAKSVKERTGVDIKTAEIDAMDVDATAELIKSTGAELVVNLALPYQDLAIMDACLKAKVNYLDTANYEPEDEAKFEYHWQWAYQDKFKEAGLTAILGSGFDPGVTSVFATWLKKNTSWKQSVKSIFWIVTAVITAKPSRPTSTQRLISVRSPRLHVTGKMATGWNRRQ